MKRDREEDNILWAVKSPPLILSRESIWPEAEWFRSWEVTVTGTESLKPNRKLGIYFENALQKWIAQEPRLALLANNLVVRSKTHTLGEFDLIVRNENWTEHWEIAVKFFLGIALFLFGITYLTSLYSFSPADPGFNQFIYNYVNKN